MAQIFIGDVVHSKSLNEFTIINNGFVAVGDEGKILAVGQNYQEWSSESPQILKNAQIVELNEDQFLMPGFVDCHIHAPQVAQIGLGLNLPLLDWLDSYTFPLESQFSDRHVCEQTYDHAVRSTINNGTTLASYFGTNHHEGTLVLAKKALQYGQRALVGKVCSDCNSPDFYVEDTKQSVADTLKFVKAVEDLNSNLIHATITPRFAVSCSMELMQQLGNIAKTHDLHIQSHISENAEEIKFVNSLHGSSYAQVYAKAGLLTKKTVMAHAVHLEEEEIKILHNHGTSVAHCPASNTLLSSGLCDVLQLIKGGLQVGLGTDVSGGNSMSIKDCMLQALQVSLHLQFFKQQHQIVYYKPLNYKQAFYLATLGGAEALSMADVTGNFIVGKQFDALIVDTSIPPLNNLKEISKNANTKDEELKLLEKIQRYIYVGDERNIIKVYVAGKELKHKTRF